MSRHQGSYRVSRATATALHSRSGTLRSMSLTPLPVPKLAQLANVPHALPYQGSKRLLAHAIVRLIPDDTRELVEPFAGSAAVSIAALYGGFVTSATINDINEPLMELWRQIVSDPETLADDYEKLWNEQLDDPRSFFMLVREKFNTTHEPHLLLYLLARCVKAAVRYSKNGEFNQSADNRRLGARPKTMRDRLIRTSQTLRGTRVTSGDYSDPLLNATENSVVYMDPPYQGVSNARDHRYMRGLERNEFESVLREAVHTDKSFIVSYDAVTEDQQYGEALSADLGLVHLHVEAGRSSQATLQGIEKTTVESLYLSPTLVERLGGETALKARLVSAEEEGLWPAVQRTS